MCVLRMEISCSCADERSPSAEVYSKKQEGRGPQLPPPHFVPRSGADSGRIAQLNAAWAAVGVLSMKGSPSHSNGVSPTHWQQNGGKALLSITISDPEKHGSSSSLTNAFVDFKIETRTELPQFCAKEFFVRRRYRDFVWLRQRLCTAFPGAIVPPLPEPDSLLKDDRFSSAFIQRRQAGLQLFLRRVAAHSALARGADLQTFLEAKVWELQTAKNANSSSWLTRFGLGLGLTGRSLTLALSLTLTQTLAHQRALGYGGVAQLRDEHDHGDLPAQG